MSKLYTVVGGQYGSEGKGQIAAFLGKTRNITHGVRIGGPNAGHTFYTKNQRGERTKVVSRSLPSVTYLGVPAVIGAEGLFDLDLLKEELRKVYEITGKKASLKIDTNAAIITEEDIQTERHLKGEIGSTGEGVGACTARRIMRGTDVTVGQKSREVMDALSDVPADIGLYQRTSVYLNTALAFSDGGMVLEGTQGWGLGLYTSGHFPFCTSRESTPFGLWAGTGINPQNADESETIMVFRTYPIRVGGNSGDLPREVTWEELEQITDGYVKTPEITSVTKKERRIAKFDRWSAETAIQQCRPDSIAVSFLDYVYPELANCDDLALIMDVGLDWIRFIEDMSGVPVKYISTGPGVTVEVK